MRTLIWVLVGLPVVAAMIVVILALILGLAWIIGALALWVQIPDSWEWLIWPGLPAGALLLSLIYKAGCAILDGREQRAGR